MTNKRKFWIFLAFYLLNAAVVVLVISLWTDNTFLEILLAVYLMILTGFFSYANRKRKK